MRRMQQQITAKTERETTKKTVKLARAQAIAPCKTKTGVMKTKYYENKSAMLAILKMIILLTSNYANENKKIVESTY